jgi:hypothetical protein
MAGHGYASTNVLSTLVVLNRYRFYLWPLEQSDTETLELLCQTARQRRAPAPYVPGQW